MRRVHLVLLLATALVSPLVMPAQGQGAGVTRLALDLDLHTARGEVTVRLAVGEPGSVAELSLHFGQLATLSEEGQVELTGAWTWEPAGCDPLNDRSCTAVANLRSDGQAAAVWTARGTTAVVSTEGRGETSHVGEDFAVVKVSDLVPRLSYAFPKGSTPSFGTELQVQAPQAWTVAGPWARDGDTFRLTEPIPRGFLAAGPEIVEGTLQAAGQTYRVVRVAGASEAAETQRLLEASESFLEGLYGTLPINRYIVVAPDPMFRGGLANPEGIFLHAEADAAVVAHELVHAYQSFQVSRTPGAAAVWLSEGAAVVHGAQLEAAAGLASREEIVERMQQVAETARRDHGAVDLTNAVYGTPNEQAAYTKGAVVVVALSDVIRNATGNAYSLADVLHDLGPPGAEGDPLTTDDLAEAVARSTGVDVGRFFARYVRGQDLPALGAVFPGQASVRVLGTDPAEPLALQPFAVRVALTNLDVREVEVNQSVRVNGSVAGRLVATLAPGERAEAEASITPLPRGTYTVRVDGATTQVWVRAPASLNATVETWPDPPVAGAPVTVGMVVVNEGEATARGNLTLVVDGEPMALEPMELEGGARRTVPVTLAPLALGEHAIQIQGPGGEVVATRSVTVAEPPDRAGIPEPGALVTVILALLLAGLAPARARRR